MSCTQVLIGVIVVALIALGAAAWYLFAPTPDAAAPAPPSAGVTDKDRTLGDPKAPITVIEYAAPMCPHCAHFNETGIPHLRADYIDKGKVFYVFRVFPIGAPDVAAEAIARCLPADNYFQFIDLLFRNQAKWDPENGITGQGVQDGLVGLARVAGMSGDKAVACMNNKDEQTRVMSVAQDAETRYGISGTPTFVINGDVLAAGSVWPDVKAKLDSLLAKK